MTRGRKLALAVLVAGGVAASFGPLALRGARLRALRGRLDAPNAEERFAARKAFLDLAGPEDEDAHALVLAATAKELLRPGCVAFVTTSVPARAPGGESFELGVHEWLAGEAPRDRVPIIVLAFTTGAYSRALENLKQRLGHGTSGERTLVVARPLGGGDYVLSFYASLEGYEPEALEALRARFARER